MLAGTPLDIDFPFAPYDCDLVVKGYEYVRQRLFEIVPFLPERLCAQLIVSGHPHNPEPIAMILLVDPDVDAADWGVLAALDAVQAWVDHQDPALLRQLAEATAAPSHATLAKAYEERCRI